MITISTHRSAKRCPHGCGAILHCPTCRRERANAAQRRSKARRQARAAAEDLVRDMFPTMPYEGRAALLSLLGVSPDPWTSPLWKTCEHGKRPMCDICKKAWKAAYAKAYYQRMKRRKYQGQCEGMTDQSEGGLEYPEGA